MSNPVFVKTVDNYITAAMKVLLGAAPGNTYLNQFRSFVTENGGGTKGLAAYASALANYAGTDNAALAATVVANLGITGDAATTATANVKALFDAKGAARGEAVLQLVEVMVNLQGDATWGTVANNFVNGVNAAYVYSVNTANTSTDLATLKAAVVTSSTGVVSNPGQVFTLTAGADTLTPTSVTTATKTTAGDDTIRVVVAGDLATTDYVDAGAGTDTLNQTVGLVAAINPALKDVEIVNILFAAGGQVNMAGSTGYTEVNSVASTALGAVGGGDFSNIKLGTTVGVVDSNVGAVFGFASVTGAADAATLNVKDAAAAAPVTIAGIENLTVNSTAGSVAAVTANSIALTAAQAEKITVTGDQALTLAVAAASPSLANVDASALTKALTFTMTQATAATTATVTVKGSAQADTVTVTATGAGSQMVIDTGAGNDTINIGASAFHKITLGDGADTVNLATGAGTDKAIDVSTAAKLAASVIEITDFKSGTDVLAITSGGAGTETALTGTQLATIAASANLLAATQAAAALAGGVDGDATVFQFGGDTYIFVNESGADTVVGTADLLIKLTGVTSTVAADITVA